MTDSYTSRYNLTKPQFDVAPWHAKVNLNFDLIDSLIFEHLALAGVIGSWAVNTAYTVGQRLVDATDASVWTCLVNHASGSGTFAADRTSNPTYWVASALTLTPRGAWANDTVYAYYDLVYDQTEGVVALCTTAHTSSSSPDDIRDDIANWAFVIDLTVSGTTAALVSFDNSATGFTAIDVQAAIDEFWASVVASLALKAPLASPVLTGAPTAPTPATADSSTKIATTLYVVNKLATVFGFTNFTVRGATTANIAIATDLEDGDTLDGLTLATGEFVLVKDQSAPAENGIYTVVASGAASRHASFDTYNEHVAAIINVTAGTANAGLSFRCTANLGGVLGTTAIGFLQFGSAVTFPIDINQGGTGEITAAAAFGALKQAASESATGVVELATNAETVTGTDTARATHPAGVKAAIAAGAAGISAPNVQTFNSNDTWTKPAGATAATRVFIECWGGGASGGRQNGGGGGGGAYTWRWMLASDLGATEAVTVGLGGAAKTSNGNGNDGGNTTFGAHLTAYGGGGGDSGGSPNRGGHGGGWLSSRGPVNTGFGGAVGAETAGAESAYGGAAGGKDGVFAGGASIWGGAGGGGDEGAGGTSLYGGNGGAGSLTGAATAGTQPGGGGGGTDTGTSGKGGDGRVRVTTYL
jgi:hypothetical protein